MRKRNFSWSSLPLALFLLAVIAYGVHTPWMGFYWDDWPWVWFSHVNGPAGMLQIDIEHRPITGIVLWVGSLLAGENPLGWQIYNIIWRFLGAVSLAWALKQIWPSQKNQIAWVALLFLIYPGFGQQYVAVNNSRHLFPLVTLFLSFGLMVQAQLTTQRYWPLTISGLLLSIISMFTTEYYYGLELIRPLALWIVLPISIKNFPNWFKTISRTWLPYLIPLAGVFLWRYLISKSVNYAITIFDEITSSAQYTVWDYIGFYLQDIFGAALGGWLKITQFPDPLMIGGRARLYFWGFVLIGTTLGLIYTLFLRASPKNRRWGWDALLLGLAALILGPIPFWVTGLDPRLSFPGDRLLLPSILGTCLVLVGLLDLLIPSKPAKAIIISLMIGLSVGVQYQTSINYRLDWERQKLSLQQLTWRIPALKPNTAILANQFPAEYATDNSFIAPINWLYAPDFSGGNLPIYLYYIDLRFGQMSRVLAADIPFKEEFRFYPFDGMPQNALVVYHKLPGCLRVLTDNDQNDPYLPPEIQMALGFSNLDQIGVAENVNATLPSILTSDSSPQSWCFYFERADLARQRGDWELVAELGDLAFETGFPDAAIKHVAEYSVFIEGYAHTSQWVQAQTITFDTYQIDKQMAPMLCDTWGRIATDTSENSEKNQALETISNQLECQGW